MCLSVVDPKRLLVVFYEDLFDRATGQSECDRNCAFLGVTPHPADLSYRISIPRSTVPEVDRDMIVQALCPDYEFLFKVFSGRLPPNWLPDL
jgi:hypothetical protein